MQRVVASGSGWRVFRVGRSFCVQIDRDDDSLDVWFGRPPSDVARGSGLARLMAQAQTDGERQAVTEAMGAAW